MRNYVKLLVRGVKNVCMYVQINHDDYTKNINNDNTNYGDGTLTNSLSYLGL